MKPVAFSNADPLSFVLPNPTRVRCPECAGNWWDCACVAPYRRGRELVVAVAAAGGFELQSDRNGMAS